jgi:hypothetical protein
MTLNKVSTPDWSRNYYYKMLTFYSSEGVGGYWTHSQKLGVQSMARYVGRFYCSWIKVFTSVKNSWIHKEYQVPFSSRRSYDHHVIASIRICCVDASTSETILMILQLFLGGQRLDGSSQSMPQVIKYK